MRKNDNHGVRLINVSPSILSNRDKNISQNKNNSTNQYNNKNTSKNTNKDPNSKISIK